MADIIITHHSTRDVRFPTSLDKTGSDAMNEAGDYSAAYCYLHTSDTSLRGIGMSFTIGRGNDLVCAAIHHLALRLHNKPLSSLTKNMGATWRHLVSDSQLRWVGPEKGVVHLALGAVVNALWDLWARVEQKPVWRLVSDMTPEEVVRCIDFRYIDDALCPAEALELLTSVSYEEKKRRIDEALFGKAVKAYTTSAGWLGYPDEKLRSLLHSTKAEGYTEFKLKVGASLERDKQRLAIAREILGPEPKLMVDANQVWGVRQAIDYMRELAPFNPYFIEEPTSPDDILGHKAVREALAPLGIKVATGEMVQNRVIFKQMLQAGAIDVLQVDACRLGGVNEVLAVLLLARKFNVPVVPHSGGVGLPEYTVHVATMNFVLCTGEPGLLEMVDSLHGHFVEPVLVRNGWFVSPTERGYGVEMKESSERVYGFPGGEFWKSEEASGILESANGGEVPERIG